MNVFDDDNDNGGRKVARKRKIPPKLQETLFSELLGTVKTRFSASMKRAEDLAAALKAERNRLSAELIALETEKRKKAEQLVELRRHEVVDWKTKLVALEQTFADAAEPNRVSTQELLDLAQKSLAEASEDLKNLPSEISVGAFIDKRLAPKEDETKAAHQRRTAAIKKAFKEFYEEHLMSFDQNSRITKWLEANGVDTYESLEEVAAACTEKGLRSNAQSNSWTNVLQSALCRQLLYCIHATPDMKKKIAQICKIVSDSSSYNEDSLGKYYSDLYAQIAKSLFWGPFTEKEKKAKKPIRDDDEDVSLSQEEEDNENGDDDEDEDDDDEDGDDCEDDDEADYKEDDNGDVDDDGDAEARAPLVDDDEEEEHEPKKKKARRANGSADAKPEAKKLKKKSDLSDEKLKQANVMMQYLVQTVKAEQQVEIKQAPPAEIKIETEEKKE